jgi:hypothetical protein
VLPAELARLLTQYISEKKRFGFHHLSIISDRHDDELPAAEAQTEAIFRHAEQLIQ